MIIDKALKTVTSNFVKQIIKRINGTFFFKFKISGILEAQYDVNKVPNNFVNKNLKTTQIEELRFQISC